MNLTRAYRHVNGRWVHTRIAGTGPLVVLLHGSPQSGASLIGMMDALVAAGCAPLALDTPGNGCSDALAGDPEDAEAYARALDETLSSLGVGRAAIYGFHTGAVHAAAFAGLFPHRVSALVLDGFPLWTEAEHADLLAHYLPAFAPSWDGAHLTWAWARMEAQSIFFPWYARTDAARMPHHAVPDPVQLHDNVLDLLRAGDRHRAPYASAFRADGSALLSKVTAPTLLCAGARDPLFVHLDRIASAPTHVEVRRHGFERPQAWADMASWLAARARDTAPALAAPGADAAGTARRYVGQTRVYEIAGVGAPIARVHDLGDSIEAQVRRGATTGRPLLLIERPEHGESGASDEVSIEQYAKTIAKYLGWNDASIEIESGPRPVCCAPTWDGAHLAAAWRYAWRRTLFEPWDTPDVGHARAGTPDVDAIHAGAVDLLKAWRAFE